MIYDELTAYMMQKIATCASPTAYAYLLDRIIFKYESTPRFLKSRIVENCSAVEIAKAFYCKYSGFEVKHPLRIATLLQRGLFKLGSSIKPANYPLRALTVDGSLLSNSRHYIDVKLLPAHFATLSCTEQRLAPEFSLTIHLWTENSSRKSVEEIAAQGMALRRTLQALKPLFAKLIENEPKATQSVILEVERRQKLTLDMALAEKSPQRLAKTICNWCCELQDTHYREIENELTPHSLNANEYVAGNI
ncbi:uncharacterized protein ALTATR162_LOCUS6212 [Alternaria atra]|jgi:hypothetical protein|uniref:Uncharacterized protein n=1 Tax=Alternaria atra TaxID=119953 RepID=A0A8J2N6R1_9PLEO|nr:uncharacterized protein ALTATR162_LOCUS6212 [Alternaria atra]CAG5162404.1 unnamed protein product [Alternaria atra]